jgi:hypothetical protein
LDVRAVVLLVVTACGRLQFDPVGTGGPGSGLPDGDGGFLVDSTLQVGVPRRVATGTEARLAFSSGQYAIAYTVAGGGIDVVRVDESGTVLPPVAAVTRTPAFTPDIAESAGGFTVVWSDDRAADREVWGMTISTTGQQGTETLVAPSPANNVGAQLARIEADPATGGIAVAYSLIRSVNTNCDVRLARRGPQLALVNDSLVQAGVLIPFSTVVVGDDGSYAVSWNNNEPVSFTRLNAQGTLLQPVMMLTSAPADVSRALVARTGQYAYAWGDGIDGTGPVRVTTTDSQGVRLRETVMSTPGTGPALIATPTGYAIAGQVLPGAIDLVELDPEGRPVAAPVRVTDRGYEASLVWDGSGYGVAWLQIESSTPSLVVGTYFTRVAR